jgi:hypothetical protein
MDILKNNPPTRLFEILKALETLKNNEGAFKSNINFIINNMRDGRDVQYFQEVGNPCVLHYALHLYLSTGNNLVKF